MSRPTLWQRFRQNLGRAFRESGQALDRLAIKTESLAVTKHSFYDDPVIYEDHLSRHRHRFPLLQSGKPRIHGDVAYLAPCSTLIGSVHVDKGASIWYGAVLRADECYNAQSFNQPDELEDVPEREMLPSGEEKSDGDVQAGDVDNENGLIWKLNENRFDEHDNHFGGGIFIGRDTNVQDGCIITARTGHCIVGAGVTVGHLAQIHSATVGDFSLIGMGSVVQEGAVIESEALVAAGAIVAGNQVVKAGELWVGNPARKLRDLSAEERQKLHYQSSEYTHVAATHKGVMEMGGNLPESIVEENQQLEIDDDEDTMLGTESYAATEIEVESVKATSTSNSR